MQEHAVADETVPISSERGVASNYAPILVGMFIFPIIFFGLFAAKKRPIVKFQYRTQWVSLWEFLPDSLWRLLFYPAYRKPKPARTPDNVFHPGIKTQFSFVRLGGASAPFAAYFLAGGSRTIANPKNYWAWPKPA
jgi:hypothetical protein